MARKTVYVPEEVLRQLADSGAEGEPNLSKAFQEFLLRKAEKARAARAAYIEASQAEVFERWRPSKVREIAKGLSAWTAVDFLSCGIPGNTLQAVRSVLEEMGVRVNLFMAGTAQHVVNLLNGHESSAPYLILGMEADGRGFTLPRLAKELEEKQPAHKRLTPEDLQNFVDLPGRTVISFGGGTGTSVFAKSFLDNGCVAYLAPGDPRRYPFWYASTFAVAYVFYELVQGRPLEDAVERLRMHDDELAMWKLFR